MIIDDTNFDLIQDLDSLINDTLTASPVPVEMGNSLRIKDYIIRKTKVSYKVYDITDNGFIAETNFKISAVLLVNYLLNKNTVDRKILDLDTKLLKHVNDIKFFKNAMKGSKDPSFINTRLCRILESQIASTVIKDEMLKYMDTWVK